MRATLRHGRQKIEHRVKRAASSLVAYATQSIWKEAECLFVLSTGRTGTKTLARILDLSDDISAFHEPAPQLMEERKAARWEISANPYKYRHIFIRSRGASLFTAVRSDKIYAETSARLTFFAPVIAKLLPNAKFLYIHRDPAEVIRSGMRRGWYVDHPADYARVLPVEGENFYEGWKDRSQFEKICWYWKTYNEFALEFCRLVDPARTQVVNASALFDGSAVPQIFDLMDVQSPSNDEVGRVLGKKLNAQKSAHFPRADDWTSEMYQTLHDIAGHAMEQLGYVTRHTATS